MVAVHMWSTAEIEQRRREIAELVADLRVEVGDLARRPEELHDRNRRDAFEGALMHLGLVASFLANAKRTPSQRTETQRHAAAMVPGEQVYAEEAWHVVEASRRYDGWVSITVPGMELRFREDEVVRAR